MRRLSLSLKVYFLLVIILAASNALQAYFQVYQGAVPAAELPAPPFVLALANAGIAVFLYGGLGLIGLALSRKLEFADIWDSKVSNRRRFLIPAILGAGLGVILILADMVFAPYNGIGRFQHPAFPFSILASLSAGIGEEILFRLFFIPIWTWLISSLILRGRGQNVVFLVVSIISALGFALGHLPAVMYMYGFTSVGDISPVLISEIILLNGVISMFAAYYMKKDGFLAAAGIHFWTDIVWHVIWGLVQTLP